MELIIRIFTTTTGGKRDSKLLTAFAGKLLRLYILLVQLKFMWSGFLRIFKENGIAQLTSKLYAFMHFYKFKFLKMCNYEANKIFH